MLFDLAYGWRKWRGQRGLWYTLILSLCLFCSLIAFVFNLFWLLNSDRPAWVNNPEPMITFANKDLNGNLQTTTGFDIDLMLGVAHVKQVASIAIEPSNITLDLAVLPKVGIGFYSSSALEVLGLPAPFSLQNIEAKKGIISQRFWQQHFEASQDLTDKVLYYRDIAFSIAGVAPVSMSSLGSIEIDIWLPDSLLQDTVPEMFAKNPELYLKTKNNRYGFAQLTEKLELSRLKQAYTSVKKETPRPDGGFVDTYYQPWLIGGVELDPNGRDVLQRQAWILLLLLIGFGFIIFSGIVSAYAQQAILRQPEMHLKIALGGDSRSLVVQLLSENLPALILVSILSPVIGVFLTHYVSSISVYQQYFPHGIHFNVWLWIIALLCSLLLFSLCSLIPLRGAFSGVFSRGRLGHMTKGQRRLTQVVLVLQLAVITSVMVLSLSLMSQEWRKYSVVALSDNIRSYQPEVTGRLSLMLTAEQQEGDWSVANNNIALASHSFTQLGAQNLTYHTDMGGILEKPINGVYVSQNFFSVLGVTLLINGELLENTIIINHAMASQLSSELALNSWRETLGITIKLTGYFYEKQVRIVGVVQDLPHFGIAKDVKPLIYLNLKDQNSIFSSRVAPTIYSQGGDEKAIALHLNDWARLQSSQLSYAAGISLVDQIAATDAAGKLLFLTSSIMTLLILVLVAFTLYNKFSYAVNSEQIKWAVMLAVGARKEALIVRMIWQNLGLSLLAIIITIVSLLLLEDHSQDLLNVSLFQPLVWAACIALSIFFIVSITFWSAQGLLKQKISTLLQNLT